MKESTLEMLKPLLSFLRSFDVLEETGGVKFLLKGRDFVHFHDDPDGLWADAKLSKGRLRMSVATLAEQRELMEKIAAKLDSIESYEKNDHRKERRSDSRRRLLLVRGQA